MATYLFNNKIGHKVCTWNVLKLLAKILKYLYRMYEFLSKI